MILIFHHLSLAHIAFAEAEATLARKVIQLPFLAVFQAL
jgi:hypothetical protein